MILRFVSLRFLGSEFPVVLFSHTRPGFGAGRDQCCPMPPEAELGAENGWRAKWRARVPGRVNLGTRSATVFRPVLTSLPKLPKPKVFREFRE